MGSKKKQATMKKSSSRELTKLLQSHSATAGIVGSGVNGGGNGKPGSFRRSDSMQIRFDFNFKFTCLVLLWLARVAIVLLPQNGYIQPDEFFQFTEPLAGDVFGVENLRVWEFNQTAPLRSMFFPSLFSLPPFYLLKSIYISGDISTSQLSAYFLLVGPRLLMTFASFLIDYSVYRLCMQLYPPSSSCKSLLTAKTLDTLLAHASSYLAFVYYTHTFSNTVETILFGFLLVVVVESFKQHNSGLLTYWKLALILAFGFFNRPTFAVFASVPILYWAAMNTSINHSRASTKLSRSSWGSWISSCLRNIFTNSFNLLLPFILISITLILVDSIYHNGFDLLINAISELSFVKLFQNIVLTPLNFLVYNLQTKNLANHGLHPVWFHCLLCMPWMFTVLTLFWYIDLVMKLKSHFFSSKSSRSSLTNPIISLFYFCMITTLIGFSSRPHHEPRFLLPLIIPIVCLFGHRLFTSRAVAIFWLFLNLLLTVFYGQFHQAGVVPSLSYLQSNVIQSPSNVSTKLFFARQYLPPRHLLTISKQQIEKSQFKIYDLSILDFPSSFEQQLSSITPDNSDIYLTIPSCHTPLLKQSLSKHFPNINLTLVHQHFPHFSSEDFDQWQSILKEPGTDFSPALFIVNFWTRLRSAFSMNIWKLTWK